MPQLSTLQLLEQDIRSLITDRLGGTMNRTTIQIIPLPDSKQDPTCELTGSLHVQIASSISVACFLLARELNAA